jgi:hypothetical protein
MEETHGGDEANPLATLPQGFEYGAQISDGTDNSHGQKRDPLGNTYQLTKDMFRDATRSKPDERLL